MVARNSTPVRFAAALFLAVSCSAQVLSTRQPSDAELFRQAAEFVRNRQYAKAIPLFKNLVASSPGEFRYHLDFGFALWSKGDPELAAKEFETALRINPSDPVAQYYLGRIQEDREATDQAIQCYERAIASDEPVRDAYARLIALYKARENWARAAEITLQAIRRSPWEPAGHYLAGTLYRKTGRMKEAQQEFETAKRLRSIDDRSTRELAELRDAVDRKQDAQVMALREELLREQTDPDVVLSLGVVLGQGGYDNEALEPLRRAVEALPESYASNFDLGLTLLKLGHYSEAEPPLKQASIILPDSFDVQRALGVLYAAQRRTAEAIANLKAASLLQPQNGRVLALLGEQYLAGGHPVEAIQTLEEARRIDPRDPRLIFLLEQACRRVDKSAVGCLGIPQ